MAKSKNLKFHIFLAILLCFFISSCSTDVDVIGEWKETMVVYGLLNPSDAVHYIKIGKAFLGEEDAFVMAQEYDSLYYSNDLEITLQRIKSGVLIETITLQKDASITKDSGTFSSPNQILYKTNQPIYGDSKYTLEITNTNTGNYTTASTFLVKDFTIDKPKTTESVNWNLINSDYKVKWQSAENGKLYQLTIRFNYTEENTATQVTESKYIDWVFTPEESNNTSAGEDMEVAIDGQSFYTFVASMIEPNGLVNRSIGKLDFIITIAAEDFTTYMEVNQPSSGVLQEKPVFTNIENGIGIFSSRFEKTVSGLNMSTSSQDSLRFGSHTKNLGFL